MNSGFWISWYNLPEEGRDEYLAWLHGSYIPMVLKRPGVLGAAHYASEANPPISGAPGRLRNVGDASVPAGDRYILVFGGKTPYAFAGPAPSIFHAGLPAVDRIMLAMRIGERYNIATEEARIYGPEFESAKAAMGPGLAPGIQLGSFNAGPGQDEDELAAWYAQWRLPCMQKLPGCVRVRKYASVSGWAKHMILYEFTSTRARDGSRRGIFETLRTWPVRPRCSLSSRRTVAPGRSVGRGGSSWTPLVRDDSGITTRKNVPHTPQPSIHAASSSERGTASKKLRMVQITKARLNVR